MDITVSQDDKDKSSTFQGPTSSGGFNANEKKLQQLASNNDPIAQEVLNLMQARKELETHLLRLKNDSEELGRKISNYQSELSRVNSFMVGVVIAVVIAFFFMLFDLEKDKDLYSNYNNVYQVLTDRANRMELIFKDVESSITLLRAKNPYLK